MEPRDLGFAFSPTDDHSVILDKLFNRNLSFLTHIMGTRLLPCDDVVERITRRSLYQELTAILAQRNLSGSC